MYVTLFIPCFSFHPSVHLVLTSAEISLLLNYHCYCIKGLNCFPQQTQFPFTVPFKQSLKIYTFFPPPSFPWTVLISICLSSLNLRVLHVRRLLGPSFVGSRACFSSLSSILSASMPVLALRSFNPSRSGSVAIKAAQCLLSIHITQDTPLALLSSKGF